MTSASRRHEARASPLTRTPLKMCTFGLDVVLRFGKSLRSFASDLTKMFSCRSVGGCSRR